MSDDWNGLGKHFQIALANRIMADNVCVIEGDESELQQAWSTISTWRMAEECRERKIDHDFIRRCNNAENAIRRRLAELFAIDKATD